MIKPAPETFSKHSGIRLRTLTTVFHLVTFVTYVYTLYYDLTHIPALNHRETYGGRFKFLTFWNFCIQMVYFGYSVINDLFGSNTRDIEHRSTLQVVRDRFVASIAFPGGLLVVAAFWTIYAIDRQLIFPKELDAIIPGWLNHAWHTNVIVFLLIEKFLVVHLYPSPTKGLATSILFGLSYQLWIFWIAYAAGFWVYPVLEVLNWPARILFLATCWAAVAVCYFVGLFITNLLWCKADKTKGE